MRRFTRRVAIQLNLNLRSKFIMFYHPNDNLFTVIIKHLVGFAALIALFALLVYAIFDDAQIPQRDITLLINIDDQVNICRPDEDGFAEKSFFNF